MLSAWREVRVVARLRRSTILVLAVFGAVAGLMEVALIAVVASSAIAVATDKAPKLGLGPLGDLAPGTLMIAGAVLAAGTLLLNYLIQRGLARMYSDTVSLLRSEAIDDYLRSDWSTQSDEPEGVFMSYIVTNIPRVANVATAIVTALTSGVTMGVFLLAAVALSPVAAGGGIALVAVLGLLFRPLQHRARAIGVESNAATRKLFMAMAEAVSATREIKVFGAEGPVVTEMEQHVADVEGPAFRTRLLASIVPVMYQRAVYVMILGALAVIRLLDLGNLGAVGAALLLVLRGLQQAQVIQGQNQQVAESRPWIGALEEKRAHFREGRRPRGDVALERVERVELRGASLVYPDGTVAFRGLDLELERGELLGVVGPSGSGKTSLAEVVVGLRGLTEGEFLVNGRPADDHSPETWADQVAVVSQFAEVVTGSVVHNISFYRDELSRQAVEDSAREAHLAGEIQAMPDGFDTVIAHRGERALSGGQRQRLAIARALVGGPSLVVLDEPTSALDHEAEEAIVETVRLLREQAVVVVIAHRLSTLRHCDRVLVLENGVPVSLGPAESLLAERDFVTRAKQGEWL